MPWTPALGTADTLCLHVAIKIEGSLIIILILWVGRAIHIGALILVVVYRARVIVFYVFIFGITEMLWHYERLVIELQRVVIVWYSVVAISVVRIMRHWAHGSLILSVVGIVRVRVEWVGLVRRHRSRRHGAAILARGCRRSNVRVTDTSVYSWASDRNMQKKINNDRWNNINLQKVIR